MRAPISSRISLTCSIRRLLGSGKSQLIRRTPGVSGHTSSAHIETVTSASERFTVQAATTTSKEPSSKGRVPASARIRCPACLLLARINICGESSTPTARRRRRRADANSARTAPVPVPRSSSL